MCVDSFLSPPPSVHFQPLLQLCVCVCVYVCVCVCVLMRRVLLPHCYSLSPLPTPLAASLQTSALLLWPCPRPLTPQLPLASPRPRPLPASVTPPCHPASLGCGEFYIDRHDFGALLLEQHFVLRRFLLSFWSSTCEPHVIDTCIVVLRLLLILRLSF